MINYNLNVLKKTVTVEWLQTKIDCDDWFIYCSRKKCPLDLPTLVYESTSLLYHQFTIRGFWMQLPQFPSIYLHGRLPTSVNFCNNEKKNFNRLPTLADNPALKKKKENCRLAQGSFSVQLINFHTFRLCCFIENDTTWKNLF